MRFLHQRLKLKRKQMIKVHFSEPTNVKLLSAPEFKKYKLGKTHTYYGGAHTNSPASFEIPYDGIWHAVIEKGTYNNPIDVTGNVELDGMAKKSKKASKPAEEPAAVVEAAAAEEALDAGENTEDTEDTANTTATAVDEEETEEGVEKTVDAED